MKIKLPNRDGADLYLEKIEDLENNLSKWSLKVDKKHDYCLHYLRVIGKYPDEIEAIDPSGGPYMSVGELIQATDNEIYRIKEIKQNLVILILEKVNGNNK